MSAVVPLAPASASTHSRGRVLFLTSTLAVGGAERQLALLVPELRALGFEPVVATLRHRGRYFDELAALGIPTVFVGMKSRTDLKGGLDALGLWKLRPDIVFSTSLDAQVVGRGIAARAGAVHVTVDHGGAGALAARHRRLLTRVVVARGVDGAIAVSPSQVAELRALGYPRERISVIPNGIPRPSPQRTREAVRSELGLASGDVLALFAATLRPEKRAAWFAEAAVRANRLDSRVRAVVAGGGPDLDRISAVAQANPRAIRVLGERRDVPDLIGSADLVCLSSRFEALPMVVLEAMALGRPVVSTRVGGVGDAVEPGKTGWLVPPDDLEQYAQTLARAAADPAARTRMGLAAACAYEERYTLERMVEAYAAVLDRLTGRG